MIGRVNLGLCEINEISESILLCTQQLLELHETWRSDNTMSAMVASLSEDTQIGVDFMGLANLLAIKGITYRQFNDACEGLSGADNIAVKIVHQLTMGMYQAGKWVNENSLYPMKRLFTDRKSVV